MAACRRSSGVDTRFAKFARISGSRRTLVGARRRSPLRATSMCPKTSPRVIERGAYGAGVGTVLIACAVGGTWDTESTSPAGGSSEAAASSLSRSICMSGPRISRRVAVCSKRASKAACEVALDIGASAGAPDEATVSRLFVSASISSARAGGCVGIGGVEPPAWAGKVESGTEGGSEEGEGAEDPLGPARADAAGWGAGAPFPFPKSGVVTVPVMLKVVSVRGREWSIEHGKRAIPPRSG